MVARGEAHTRHRATQVRDFSGLRYGRITPTDIDALLDFGGQAFVIVEVKFTGNELPAGQRLAIERIVDALAGAGRLALALVASHHAYGDIDFAACRVTEFRWAGAWQDDSRGLTVKEAVDAFLVSHDLAHYVQFWRH